MTAKPRVNNRGKEVAAELIALNKEINKAPWSEIDSDGIHSDLIIARNALKAARAKLEIHNE